ncbi:lysoplasmalogenase [Tenacibaculum geojense]|uniref:Lysoplasmalogenase n=1 Tax=Tenacibaculum geojense TaxID=915352 RepID=A0ABW3JNQ9_9FLAO
MKNLKPKNVLVTVLFLIVSMANFYSVYFDNFLVEMISKPLIVTFLAILYLINSKKLSFWFLSALLFSFWGDVLLLFNDSYFVFGLASFFLSHVFYTIVTVKKIKTYSIKNVVASSIPYVLFLIILLYLIYENLHDFLAPVIIYGIVISVFGVTTLVNFIQNKTTENGWLFLGATIFIISDSLIALNKFYETKHIYGILIMITYVVAQYLICKSIITTDQE